MKNGRATTPFYSDSPASMHRNITKASFTIPANFGLNLSDLLSSLLTTDQSKRLGCSNKSSKNDKDDNTHYCKNEAMNHPWFDDFDWDALYKSELPSYHYHDNESDNNNYNKVISDLIATAVNTKRKSSINVDEQEESKLGPKLERNNVDDQIDNSLVRSYSGFVTILLIFFHVCYDNRTSKTIYREI